MVQMFLICTILTRFLTINFSENLINPIKPLNLLFGTKIALIFRVVFYLINSYLYL